MRRDVLATENDGEADFWGDGSRVPRSTVIAAPPSGGRRSPQDQRAYRKAIVSVLGLVCCLVILSGCSSATIREGSSEEWSKIGFDLSLLDADGLLGGSEDKRAVHYEFCIPAQAKYVREVSRIDSTIVVSPTSGKIGCSADQYLAIGSTHQEEFRDVLLRLARLDFVELIKESPFE